MALASRSPVLCETQQSESLLVVGMTDAEKRMQELCDAIGEILFSRALFGCEEVQVIKVLRAAQIEALEWAAKTYDYHCEDARCVDNILARIAELKGESDE